MAGFYTWTVTHLFQYSFKETNYFAYWIVLDLVFILVVEWRFRNVAASEYIPSEDTCVVTSLFNELLNEKSVPDLKLYIESWFFGVSLENIKKVDMIDWAAGLIFNSTVADLSSAQLGKLESFFENIESRLSIKFSYGETPSVRTMLVTLDPIEIFHRPILFYAGVKCLEWVGWVAMWRKQFIRINDKGMTTYIKKGSSQELPLVFFHGIGIGITPYLRLIFTIMETFPNRTIILFEKKSISMKLTRYNMLPEEYSLKVYQILQKENIDKIQVIGHSLGTAIICWLDNYYPGLVYSRIFLDPVCFSLWTSDITKNFKYRSPKHMKDFLRKYFASMEPGISVYIQRYFIWYQCTYYSSNLPTRTKIYLSEFDDIVNSQYIYDYMSRFPHPDRKTEVIRGVRHGEYLGNGDLGPLLDDITRLSSCHFS